SCRHRHLTLVNRRGNGAGALAHPAADQARRREGIREVVPRREGDGGEARKARIDCSTSARLARGRPLPPAAGPRGTTWAGGPAMAWPSADPAVFVSPSETPCRCPADGKRAESAAANEKDLRDASP